MNSKLNIYFIPSIGKSFGKTSSSNGTTKDDPQAELIYLNDRRTGIMVQVQNGDPFDEGNLFISSEIGIEYRLFKNAYLTFGLRYNNEIVNENSIIVWGYNIKEDRLSGGYTPYDMQFKSLFTNFGLKYSF